MHIDHEVEGGFDIPIIVTESSQVVAEDTQETEINNNLLSLKTIDNVNKSDLTLCSSTYTKVETEDMSDLSIELKKKTRNNDQTNYINTNLIFAYTSMQLWKVLSQKDFRLLKSIGGLRGIIEGLRTDPKNGLNTDEESKPLNCIMIEEFENIPHDKDNILDKIPDKETSSAELTNPTDNMFSDRIKAFGINDLPKSKIKSIFELMWMAMQEKVLILLTIAAIISLGLGLYEDFSENASVKIRWVEGVAIVIAIVIVVMVGSLNDWQKEKQFQKLNEKKEDREVKVIRDGIPSLISVHKVLVGDILQLEPGDVIPADGILISGYNIRCDESEETGESNTVKKMKYDDCIKELSNSDSLDFTPDPFIISGTKVSEGVGTYVVTGVGVNSSHGTTLISLRSENGDTPLQAKLNDLAEQIAKLGGASALLMLLVLLIKYFISFRVKGVPSAADAINNLVRIIISAVTVVVVAVPEGLPLAVTLALAYATTRMLKDNNLVRVLSACETMGNATTICSDKTGTLTQNKMTVMVITIGLTDSFSKNTEAYRNSTMNTNNIEVFKNTSLMEDIKNLPERILNILYKSISINTTAFEGKPENGNITFVGSKTETALLQFLLDLGINYKQLKDNAEIIQFYPFSSERKAMGVIIREGSFFRFYVKGASEIILEKSQFMIDTKSGQETKLTDDKRDITQKIIEYYATQSLRTIAIAYRDFEQWPPSGIILNSDGGVEFEDLMEDVTLLCIVGIEDPLRDGVQDAVTKCKEAGVKVRMVTGDNILTAKSIAKQCGIYSNSGKVMEGSDFRKLNDEEMKIILPQLQVLARSSPEDKRKLVRKLKELFNDIVAVTGDGTNDGPALKTADVGFSMGISGTEVAKEASSIILMDDNFSSIVKAIMWGRCVNDAVKKFLQFQLTVNVTAVTLTFISAVSSDDQRSVLTAVQLLWVNLIMDTFAALALATDPPTQDLLKRKPENRDAPLITPKMWKMIIGQSIFQLAITLILLYAADDIVGYTGIQLNTIVFNTFVMLQIFNEINCRNLDEKLNVLNNVFANKFFIGIFIATCIGQVLIVQFGGPAFQTSPLTIIEWLCCIGFGFLSIPVGIIIRLISIEKLWEFPHPPQKRTPSSIDDNEDAVTSWKDQLKFFKTLRGGGRFRNHFGDKRKQQTKGFTGVAVVPSLMVSASLGVGIPSTLPIQNTQNTNQKEKKITYRNVRREDMQEDIQEDMQEDIQMDNISLKNQNDNG